MGLIGKELKGFTVSINSERVSFVLQQASKKKDVCLKSVADDMGLAHMVLLNKLNPNKPDTHLSPEQFNHALEHIGLEPLEEIANQHGKTLVDLSVLNIDLRALHFKCEKERSDVVRVKAKFYADGELNMKELAVLVKEKREHIAAEQAELAAMVAALEKGDVVRV